jgi:probable HAF family extracellular repeat protein
MFGEVIYNGGFVDDGGGITSFVYPGALATNAFGINNSGQIVGYTPTADSAGTHGFLESGGSFYSINDPNTAGTVAFGINNVGDSNGVDHGFTVRQRSPRPIPGAGFLSYLAIGLLGLGLLGWKRAAGGLAAAGQKSPSSPMLPRSAFSKFESYQAALSSL